MDNRGFEAAIISEEIMDCYNELSTILENNGYDEELSTLSEVMNKIKNEDKIKMAFIGQYTAGKSSIISAITGNNEIVIDSDISTSTAKSYEWGGMYLTDTPGLYTENREHDEITKAAIKESDLLVYCITSDLFNEHTLEDFKKWAYKFKYFEKMFLVINKMSKEAGDYETLVNSYTTTINSSLMPNSINEFSHSFIDAKDYREGVSEGDQDLIQISHFDSLIDQLNRFVRVKGQLAKLDTPIKAIANVINEIYINEVDDEKTKIYLKLLDRLEKRVEHQKKQAVSDVNYIIRKELNRIIMKGYELSKSVGIEEIGFTEVQCEEFIQNVCNDINAKIDEKMAEGRTELAEETIEVMESEVAEYYFTQINAGGTEKGFNPFKSKEKRNDKKKLEAISEIADKASSGVVKLSTKSGSDAAASLLKASTASGSKTHKAVLVVGQKLGYKFKPWQAAKIAKNIGNVAKFVGPVMSVLGLFLDIKEAVDEESELKEIRKAQEEYKQSFRDIAANLEEQYVDQIKNYIDIYTDVLDKIKVAKNDTTKEVDKGKSTYQEIKRIENKLDSLQEAIYAR